MLDLDSLRALLDTGEAADRAFVDAMLRFRWANRLAREEREEIASIHRSLRAMCLAAHASTRRAIARGALRGDALRGRFDAVAEFERDHFVEEVLGIAYPPLDEQLLAPELTPYTPSGYDEIVHAFDATRLGPGERFVDLGSGTGKAVLLAALLTGATSFGIELDPALHDIASAAASDLGLANTRLQCADVRDVAFEDADVVFMYLPFSGSVLASVMARLMARPPRFLCAGAVDTRRYPNLVESGPSRSWLHVYATGS